MSSTQQPAPKRKKTKGGVQKNILQLIFSLIVLGCAAALASHYIKTPPKAKPRARTPQAPLVTVKSIQPQNIIYEFDAMGTVTSAREISLTPRVSGEVIDLSPEMAPGGYVKTGDHLVTIDPTDYELNILQLQGDLAKVTNDLELEMGSQRIALQEFELLGEEVSAAEKKLMLREPQLGIARAAVANAEAQLKRARLDLFRTKITAPFNGVVLSKMIDIGSHVNQNVAIAQLAGTDQFWVKVRLPVEQLRWLNIPTTASNNGSPARIFSQEYTYEQPYRLGHVIRLAASLETEGRMAELYLSVEDPLSLRPENRDKPQLLLGTFVQVIFRGKELKNVFRINRNHLHENDSIWLLTDGNTLDIKKINILAKTKNHVYTTTALSAHPRLITSQIPSPSAGTPLQLFEKNTSETEMEQTP